MINVIYIIISIDFVFQHPLIQAEHMKKILTGFVLFLLSISISYANMIDDAVKRGKLKVGMNPAYMPFEMTNKKGEIIGFEVDILKAMTKAMGVELEIITIAHDGLIPSLLTEKFDLVASGMTITQERNIKVNFTDPFIMTGQTLLVRKELASEIKSYKDLNNPKYKITSNLGTTGEKTAKRVLSKAQYFAFNSAPEAVLEVVNGKADAFIYDASFNVVALKRLGADKLIHLDKPITYEPRAFIIRKADYDSINWINNFLNQIKNDGTYDRLYNKWFKKTDWLKEMQ